MKAIVQHAYGSPPEVLEFVDVDKPAIGDQDVLIRVHAAGVDAGTWRTVRGEPYLVRAMFGLRRPRNPVVGRDVAGVVEAVGAKVTRIQPGDEVYAEVTTGSFAEYTTAPQDMVAPKPANLSFEEAAAVPLSGNTALQGLRDKGHVQAGQRVLINGASGGVGTFAVQIAKAFGAEVTGVCSAAKADLVRSLGADHVVDYAAVDFSTTGDRYDVVFDLVGDKPLAAYRRALTSDGTLVLSAGDGGRWLGPVGRILRAVSLSPFTAQRLVPLAATRNRDDLLTLKDLIEAGKVAPAIDRVFRLEEAAAAVRRVEEGRARGKVVVSVIAPS